MAFLSIFIVHLLFYATSCDATDVKYDEELARKMVSMSAAAYSSTPQDCLADAFPKKDNWTLVSDVNDKCDFLKDTCAVVIAISDDDQQISIAFRGTTTKGQLFLEALDSYEPEEDFNGLGMVNRYFKTGLDDVWAKVNKTLDADKSKNYVVIFSGHSLGGALASLAAVQTVKLGLRTSDQVKLITYGQPRVGDSTYAFNHDQLVPYSFRIVHQADIVPHVPKCKQNRNGTCLSGHSVKTYYHHGTEVWYQNGMGAGAHYVVCDGHPIDEDDYCSNTLLKGNGYTTSDHYLYFEHDVWLYGEAGCANDPKEPKGSKFLQIRNLLINHFQGILTGTVKKNSPGLLYLPLWIVSFCFCTIYYTQNI